MQNFDYSIPTKIYFGKGQIEKLSKIAAFGNRVLLVYGGGSIKKNGIYDKVTEILSENGIEYFELSGVEPNPRVETVEKGAQICRENHIDAVLAVGGGSSIDCAKVVAAAAKYEKYIAQVPESAKIMKDGIAAHGNEMVACGTAIDKDGKVTYWSVSRHKPSKEDQSVSYKKTMQEQLEEKRAKKKEEEALKEKRLEKAETLEKLLEKIRTGAGASVKIQEEGKGAQLDLTI